jgi:predicted RNA-binding Zn-ribbon protein involved in translation (DUF1610 family)
MIQPPPSKFVCPKCGYSKIHQPQSDALNLTDLVQICPKCGEFMKIKGEVSQIDIVVDKVKSLLNF